MKKFLCAALSLYFWSISAFADGKTGIVLVTGPQQEILEKILTARKPKEATAAKYRCSDGIHAMPRHWVRGEFAENVSYGPEQLVFPPLSRCTKHIKTFGEELVDNLAFVDVGFEPTVSDDGKRVFFVGRNYSGVDGAIDPYYYIIYELDLTTKKLTALVNTAEMPALEDDSIEVYGFDKLATWLDESVDGLGNVVTTVGRLPRGRLIFRNDPTSNKPALFARIDQAGEAYERKQRQDLPGGRWSYLVDPKAKQLVPQLVPGEAYYIPEVTKPKDGVQVRRWVTISRDGTAMVVLRKVLATEEGFLFDDHRVDMTMNLTTRVFGGDGFQYPLVGFLRSRPIDGAYAKGSFNTPVLSDWHGDRLVLTTSWDDVVSIDIERLRTRLDKRVMKNDPFCEFDEAEAADRQITRCKPREKNSRYIPDLVVSYDEVGDVFSTHDQEWQKQRMPTPFATLELANEGRWFLLQDQFYGMPYRRFKRNLFIADIDDDDFEIVIPTPRACAQIRADDAYALKECLAMQVLAERGIVDYVLQPDLNTLQFILMMNRGVDINRNGKIDRGIQADQHWEGGLGFGEHHSTWIAQMPARYKQYPGKLQGVLVRGYWDGDDGVLRPRHMLRTINIVSDD